MTAEKRTVFETRSLATPDKQGLADYGLCHSVVVFGISASTGLHSSPG